ncbi:autotransporter-associated beta strand protein [Volucribacter psittacicida]|uniref:exo-alpha-sialidase n=1 Tax=Volucribacter psittacicida TaxID=203482 RepID=A0A4R1FVP4_9PAST|nr:exo-alpha-sialidase [Volucribacter psittacicida]TCJ97924.1 autotransporter-associated beta strand protein [Volucribacter psittacicida]
MKKSLLALTISAVCLSAYSATQDLAFNYTSTKDLLQPIDMTTTFKEKDLLNLSSGSVTFRINAGSGFGAMLGASDPTQDTRYLNFYSMRNRAGKQVFGIEIKDGQNLIANNQLTATVDAIDDFQNVTYTFDGDNQEINIYVDGQKLRTNSGSKFFADIKGLTEVYLGQTKRATMHNMRFAGEVFHFDLDEKVLSEQEIQQKHQQLTELHLHSLDKYDETGAYKTSPYPVFQGGEGEEYTAKNYRIPSLLTTQSGVVIAAIDKRNQHASDWGNIDTAIRRSFDGGQTWQEEQVIIDLVSQPYGNQNAAFLIDPLMVQDKNTGRIFMLVDMFPEMRGLFGFGNNAQGSGYTKDPEGNLYRVLSDKDNNLYKVNEQGVVFDENDQATDYRVVVEGTQSLAYKDLGDLYLNDQRVGNIFLNTAQDGNDTAPLQAKRTSYLWLTYSDDDGATWSSPVDITPQVKADWMQFLGVGPGNGIQLKNGNLVMPVYYTNNTGKLNSQSAAVIISTDGGKTWVRGESPIDRWEYQNGGSQALNNASKQLTESQIIELDNGELKMFSRNMGGKVVISTSKNGGYSWTNQKIVDDILLDPYSQLSVIKYSKRINGKEIVLFANPHSGTRSRVNGKVWLGEVQDDGSIEWKYNTSITTGSYAYNSLTELPNGDIGLLYEESNQKIQYVALNIQDLVWHDNYIHHDIRKNPLEFRLNSNFEETFYKIGDGEMIKLGKGTNQASIDVYEGTVTLNQEADDNGAKQAFKQAVVHPQGTLRLGSTDQMPLSSITLKQGTLDLNGQDLQLTANNGENTGLYQTDLQGNLVNHSSTPANIHYSLSGERSIDGQLGDKNGAINLIYQPDNDRANLSLLGNSLLNVIDVKTGRITYADNSQHQATSANVRMNAELAIKGNSQVQINHLNLEQDAKLIVDNQQNQLAQLNAIIEGAGDLIKRGEGVLQLTGYANHSGNINVQQGTLALDGILTGNLNLHAQANLAGSGVVLGTTTWHAGSLIAPGMNYLPQSNASRTNTDFTAQQLSFANVEDMGGQVTLRVNNDNNDVSTWQHDRLLITGNLSTSNASGYIPVNLRLLSDGAGPTDTNNNGKYDADEGISLIQIGGNATLGIFKADNVSVVDSPYQYTLVAVDKGSAVAEQNLVNDQGNQYYDYRLQTVLQTEDGNDLEPIVVTSQPLSTRAKLKSHIPNYLVANTAMTNQAREVAHLFSQQFNRDNGLYLLQQHQGANYTSNLGFDEYGYGYKSRQNLTALGINQSINEQTSLNAMISHGRTKVEPKAEEYSKTNYKSTGLLAGIQHHIDNFSIQAGLGYYWHRSDVSGGSSIKGKQYQVFGTLDYKLPFTDNLALIPTIGLKYQQLKAEINDVELNVQSDTHKVFSQYVGARLNYQLSNMTFNLSTGYEHNAEKEHYVHISQQTFKTGKLGNAIVLGGDANINIGKSWNIGVLVNHRIGVSQAKLKDTSVTAKLAFTF